MGGGLPVGVMFAKPELAKLLVPGTHGSTLGGNPICMAVARTIFDVIQQERLLDHASALGELAFARLRNEPRIKDKISEVRGKGLMLGIELKTAPEKFLDKALSRGLLVNLTAKQVVRLAPAINIPRQQWSEGLDAVVDLIASL
jgi:acetylornithine/succinyldiaminopimelate/putrescine aminotransferase